MPDGQVVLSGGRSKRGKLRGPPGSRDWKTALKGCADEAFIDFLQRCLAWDPDERMTPPQVTIPTTRQAQTTLVAALGCELSEGDNDVSRDV